METLKRDYYYKIIRPLTEEEKKYDFNVKRMINIMNQSTMLKRYLIKDYQKEEAVEIVADSLSFRGITYHNILETKFCGWEDVLEVREYIEYI